MSAAPVRYHSIVPHGSSRVLLIAAVTVVWIPLVLLADGSAGIGLQRLLGDQ